MKIFIAAAFALVLVTCKKEKPAPEPEPTPAPTPTFQISVKINGTLFTCNTCVSSYKSGGLYGVNFNTSQSVDRLLFSFDKFPKPGDYPFKKFVNPSFIYQKNNVYYRAVNGTMKVTSADTSANGVINKLSCTFNCQTDTTGGTFFSFTEGSTSL
jgi:hypothetical protein